VQRVVLRRPRRELRRDARRGQRLRRIGAVELAVGGRGVAGGGEVSEVQQREEQRRDRKKKGDRTIFPK